VRAFYQFKNGSLVDISNQANALEIILHARYCAWDRSIGGPVLYE
jgi:hypothetical protein